MHNGGLISLIIPVEFQYINTNSKYATQMDEFMLITTLQNRFGIKSFIYIS